MIKKIIFLLLSLLLSSCISFSDIQGVNRSLTPTTQEVHHNEVNSQIRGEACVTNIMMLAAFGDSSIEEATKKANIKKISTVQTRYTHFIFYLPFFQKGCTIVTGEEG